MAIFTPILLPIFGWPTAKFKQSKSCNLTNNSLDEFKIFLHDTPTVDKVLSVFCNDDILAKQYSKISVFEELKYNLHCHCVAPRSVFVVFDHAILIF